jgi:hypothetical protein
VHSAAQPAVVAPLIYKSADQTQQHAPEALPAADAASPPVPAAAETPSEPGDAKQVAKKKHGGFRKIGHFFRRIFGAE